MDIDPRAELAQLLDVNGLPENPMELLANRLLAGRDADDPKTRLLLALLTQQQVGSVEQVDPGDSEERLTGEMSQAPNDTSPTSVDANVERRRRTVRALQRQLPPLLAELQELRSRNSIFSQALGACPTCWGSDSDCETCGGQGLPGGYQIDLTLFEQFVTPAVSQYRAQVSRENPPQPRQSQGPQNQSAASQSSKGE